MMKKKIWAFLGFALLLAAPAAAVAPPDVINYQGVLRDSDDAPLTGSFDMEFAFYGVPTGGTLLLLDEHLATGTGDVTVTGGLFNVHLGGGQISGIYASLAEMFRSEGSVHLEVRVEGQTLNPRTHVVSTAYSHNPGPRGALYVRWGRDDCPAGTTLVYSGFVASTHHTQPGSAVNQLCLASSPTWLGFSDANQNGALLYGTEYQTQGYGVIGLAPLNDLDADCALCRQPAADAMFMYPGNATCPSGWTTEYQGYLMASHYTENGREMVCVDKDAVGRPGSAANLDGNQWYPTEVECGSLPCLPYVQDREVACSVCTR